VLLFWGGCYWDWTSGPCSCLGKCCATWAIPPVVLFLR
jgi:hypothetical protein